MAVDKILQKIKAEAEAEAAALKAAAEEKAAVSRERLLAEARGKAEEIACQAELDAEETARRQMLIAELESRKSVLGVRRDVLDKAFSLAEKQLNELPREKWENLIVKLVLGGVETGREALLVPCLDRPKYEEGLLDKINEALQKAGKQGELVLCDQAGDFFGGVVIIGKECDYDASFAALLKSVRGQYEQEAVKRLFGAEV